MAEPPQAGLLAVPFAATPSGAPAPAASGVVAAPASARWTELRTRPPHADSEPACAAFLTQLATQDALRRGAKPSSALSVDVRRSVLAECDGNAAPAG